MTTIKLIFKDKITYIHCVPAHQADISESREWSQLSIMKGP